MKRLAYIDWLRGLACVLMFQTHCYDSWLSASARESKLYIWSQRLGTLPGPLFIFLSGISFALATEGLRRKGVGRGAIAKITISRGAQILGLGIVFRVQEFVLGLPKSPWTDLFRVDVLNILGISMMMMGVLCWLTAMPRWENGSGDAESASPRARYAGALAGLLAAGGIALATPLLWTTSRPSWLPWPLESYLNGVHIFNVPQVWLFPIFPWSAFAFFGLAVGFYLNSEFARNREGRVFAMVAAAGILAGALSLVFDNSPIHFYAMYDYWHTSPNFLLARCGVLLILLAMGYAWCRWGYAQKGFSPFIRLGTTSLLIYWVHIEFVYGRLSFLPKHRTGIPLASVGLLIIFLAMVWLAEYRARRKKAVDASTPVPYTSRK